MLKEAILAAMLAITGCATAPNIESSTSKIAGSFTNAEKRDIEKAIEKIELAFPGAIKNLDLCFEKKKFPDLALAQARPNRTYEQQIEDKKGKKAARKALDEELKTAHTRDAQFAILDKYKMPRQEDSILIDDKETVEAKGKSYVKVLVHEIGHLFAEQNKKRARELVKKFKEIDEQNPDKTKGHVSNYANFKRTAETALESYERIRKNMERIRTIYEERNIYELPVSDAKKVLEQEVNPLLAESGFKKVTERYKSVKNTDMLDEYNTNIEDFVNDAIVRIGSEQRLIELEQALRVQDDSTWEDIAEVFAYEVLGTTVSDFQGAENDEVVQEKARTIRAFMRKYNH